MNILIVEDNPLMRALLREAVGEHAEAAGATAFVLKENLEELKTLLCSCNPNKE